MKGGHKAGQRPIHDISPKRQRAHTAHLTVRPAHQPAPMRARKGTESTMARRFTAGVATGILIVGLAGVVIAATHTSSTSAASPSGTAIASRNGASQSTDQTTNRQW